MTHPAHVAIIGGGPAGLMAAETLAEQGLTVDLYDAMPSVGRKFLLAGVGGMNITHSEALAAFRLRYGERADIVGQWLEQFPPEDLIRWIHGLGIHTFVGTSGRVFPTDMKAAPLLRAWLQRLRQLGVQFHVRHRWQGWNAEGQLQFQTPTGTVTAAPQATLLALGGGSWAKLGSDGAWVAPLEERGTAISPLRPANCGFEAAWSTHLTSRFAGAPLKTIAMHLDLAGWETPRRGECVVSSHGLEGSLIYALSAPMRETIAQQGSVTVFIDLLPDLSPDRVLQALNHPRGARSLSSHLQSRLNLKGVKTALLWECLDKATMENPQALARAIKALPVRLIATRPLDEAISTAGGIQLEGMSPQLMLHNLPGVFCAGEMLDWEAPTGGYLLSACFASGRVAAQGMMHYLAIQARNAR